MKETVLQHLVSRITVIMLIVSAFLANMTPDVTVHLLHSAAFLVYSIAYILSKFFSIMNGETIPKCRKFHEMSCMIIVPYGILEFINIDFNVQFVLIIQWILLIIGLSLQFLSGYPSLKERKTKKIPKDDA